MTRFKWMHFLKVPTRATSDSSELPASTKFVHNVVDAGGGGGGQRTTVTLTLSASTGVIDLGEVFEILDESVDAPGRFRLYRTTAGRNVDLGRTIGTKIPNNVGLLLEDIFVAGALSIAEDPVPCSAGPDGFCAWSWSGEVGTIITMTLFIKEA